MSKFEVAATDTSKWTLAIHRVSANTAEVWVGTLYPDLRMPDLARIELTASDGMRQIHEIKRDAWQRPFRYMRQRFYYVHEFDGLRAGVNYETRFFRHVDSLLGVLPAYWQDLRSGYFTTLPERIPAAGDKPFVIGLGSCFFPNRDGGHAASSYKALYERGPDMAKPDVTFLTGDQVYLDIGFDSLSPVPSEIRQRVANDYADNWRALGSFLNRGGTWMLPDDHEYWNDYPFYDSPLPTLLALKIAPIRRAWTKAARDGVANIQRTKPVDIFSIGEDLSVCLADFRTERSEKGFASVKSFKQVIDWAKNLTCPGVLVISQPLIVEKNSMERNLLSFPEQYKKLVQALAHSGHDIVLLSGDVHYGRIASVPLGEKGGRLIEVVASPLSNLTGLNGVAAATAKSKPRKFPDPNAIDVDGVPSVAVEYDKRFRVSTRKGHPLSFVYPRERTSEHFMTIAFHRKVGGGLQLNVEAWRVRERDAANLPKRDFEKKYSVVLR